MSNDYIKEGDLVLIQTGKHINECLVLDFSPSGDYLKVGDSMGRHPFWTPAHSLLETLQSASEPESEFIDINEDEEDLIGDQWKITGEAEAAQDILAKIRNRKEEFDVDEPIEAEVITQNTLAEFDRRNSRK